VQAPKPARACFAASPRARCSAAAFRKRKPWRARTRGSPLGNRGRGAGVAAGTPVTLRFVIDVAGIFVGGATFTALSEANVDLVVTRGNVFAFESRAVINRFQPTGFVTTDVAALVGDSFEMLMKLHVSAGAVNSAQPGNAMSLADVRNTGHLYVDALSSDAEFIGSDGHRCTAPDARDSGARAIRARVHGDRPGLLRHAGKAAPRDHLG